MYVCVCEREKKVSHINCLCLCMRVLISSKEFTVSVLIFQGPYNLKHCKAFNHLWCSF